VLTRDGPNENHASTGDLDIRKRISIVGSGSAQTIISGSGFSTTRDRVFHVVGPTAELTLSDVTVSNGSTDFNRDGVFVGGDNGGGIFVGVPSGPDSGAGATLRVVRSVIENNAGYQAGAIYSHAGNLTLDATEVRINTAAASGGAIYVYLGSASIVNSSLIGNSAATYMPGILNIDGSLTVENSTLSANVAPGSYGSLYSTGTTTIRHSTIVNNQGRGVYRDGGTTTLSHTIVSGNTVSDIQGTVTGSYNLIQSGSGGLVHGVDGNLIGVNPLLEPLAYRGGSTRTHVPSYFSRAIDGGNPAFSGSPLRDQRGQNRIVAGNAVAGSRIDIGAVELQVEDPLLHATSLTAVATFSGHESGSTTDPWGAPVADNFIPVDLSEAMKISVEVRSGNDLGNGYNAAARHYAGFISYDIDQQIILPYHYMKVPGSADTTLAQPLNPGDTVVHLASVNGCFRRCKETSNHSDQGTVTVA
jgi:adhesin HecA-like repeat protein